MHAHTPTLRPDYSQEPFTDQKPQAEKATYFAGYAFQQFPLEMPVSDNGGKKSKKLPLFFQVPLPPAQRSHRTVSAQGRGLGTRVRTASASARGWGCARAPSAPRPARHPEARPGRVLAGGCGCARAAPPGKPPGWRYCTGQGKRGALARLPQIKIAAS